MVVTSLHHFVLQNLNCNSIEPWLCHWCWYRAEVSNKIHELRHRMEEQMNSRRQLEAQLHNKETQKMEEFRSKVTVTLCRRLSTDAHFTL